MIFDWTASSGLSGSFSMSNSLLPFSSSVISNLTCFTVGYLVTAAVLPSFLVPAANFAVGFITELTLDLSLSKLALPFDTGALYF